MICVYQYLLILWKNISKFFGESVSDVTLNSISTEGGDTRPGHILGRAQ